MIKAKIAIFQGAKIVQAERSSKIKACFYFRNTKAQPIFDLSVAFFGLGLFSEWEYFA